MGGSGSIVVLAGTTLPSYLRSIPRSIASQVPGALACLLSRLLLSNTTVIDGSSLHTRVPLLSVCSRPSLACPDLARVPMCYHAPNTGHIHSHSHPP